MVEHVKMQIRVANKTEGKACLVRFFSWSLMSIVYRRIEWEFVLGILEESVYLSLISVFGSGHGFQNR